MMGHSSTGIWRVPLGPIFTTYRRSFPVTTETNYSDVTMSAMASQMTSITIIYSTVCSGAEENIKAPHHGPLCGEFTGDR